MLSNLLKTIDSGLKSLDKKPVTNSFDRTLSILLNEISAVVDAKIGEQCSEAIMTQIKTTMLDSRQLQANLIQVKQKYHDLIDKSSSLHQNAKRIAATLCQFMNKINQLLLSKDFLTPLKEIQKGISELIPEKVQSQMLYLSRLFEVAFQDAVQNKINAAQNNHQEENILLKNIIKNLELEGQRGQNKNNQNKISKSYKDKCNELTIAQTMIEKMKLKQQQIMQELEAQMQRKTSIYQSSLTKCCVQKNLLEEENKVLQQKIIQLQQKLNKQQQISIEQSTSLRSLDSPKKKNKSQIQLLLAQSQQQCKQLTHELNLSVNKQVIKALFYSYEDESKEWSVRRTIRNQIYTLLGVKVIKEPQDKQKSWFNIF